TTITCRGTTYLIGTNGTGKSTILDAIQFALVGGQRDVRFNQAAMAGSRRTLTSYVRGELGTEGQRFLRGDATGVVALEFREADGTHFVHGAVVDAYEDGRSPDVVYFLVNGATVDDDWFFRSPGKLHDSRSFRRHLEHFPLPGGRAHLFARLEDYRFHLLNRLGQLKDTFPAKIVKGLAFSPLTNIRDFVHNYLLDENLVDVHLLQEQLDTLRHFEELAADVRRRIEELGRIEELDQERVTHRRLRITNGYVRRIAQGDRHLAELKQRRQELDEKRLELSRAELRREDLEESLKFARQELLDAQVALQTDATAAREKALRAEIAAVEEEVAELRRQKTRLDGQVAAEQRAAGELIALLRQDRQAVPAALERLAQGPAEPDVELLETVAALQEDLAALGSEYARRQALLDEEAARLRGEAEELARESARLRTGDRDVSIDTEAPEAARLRRLLRADLGLSADEVPYLCTLLRVPDESWQDAVEGLLGANRFHLLVPPGHYDAAMALYHKRRQKDGLHGVGLIDGERLVAYARPARAGSLAREVETDNPAARAFVDLLLGAYVGCETLEALRDQRTAVTRDCFVRRNFATSHMNPRVYRRWFIGERAIPRQLEQREQRLHEIAGELAKLQGRANDLAQRLSLTRARVRTFYDLERDLPAVAPLPAREAHLAVLHAELAELNTHSVDTLRAQVAQCQAKVEELQATAVALEREMGRLEERIATLSGEMLPGLERAADEALSEAQAFLAAEGAQELLDDARAEYERRRARQPLQAVLTNAERYENDYQTAENRSRDRLREAKQAYSLAHDFGLDQDENAARYADERVKYVESELPEYEARIAEQRALAEQELVENFVHRLREQIEDARQQLGYLNATLSTLRFGGERFEFITRPEPALRQVYDLIMDSQSVLGTSLFSSDLLKRHQRGWDLLFERLTTGVDEDTSRELQELQDYRNYLEYDIRIHYPNGDQALLTKINTKKSGGETTTPFYVAMAASFAQAYRLNQPRHADTVRLALFDEAFGKMDTARTASALKFMVDSQLQVLLATPPDKAGGLLPHVDSVRTVVRKNNHSFVIEIDKAEMLRRLDGGAMPVQEASAAGGTG
ncbi:MAG TPA: SbcC/MukB-like Walker B domain-containing protein, partial [Anaerolineae bacterium]|nr:SbcC/MukB-like Walker B domain-containing protein [Anaerolineae bacterium]